METPPSTTPATTEGQSNTKSVIALILGILSLVCCTFLLGIPAIFVGRSALKDIDEGTAPESSRGMAKAGYIMGIISTIVSCLLSVAYIVLIVIGAVSGGNNFNF